MRITGTQLALLSLAFIAGGVIVWLLISAGARPNKITIGALEFGVATEAVASTPQSNVSQPNAPKSSQTNSTSQSPSASNSNSIPKTISNCPLYKSSGKGMTLEMDIDVPAGELALIDTWGFDDRNSGVFVTITGPYRGHHTIVDGAFCGGIPVTANYEPVKQQRLDQLKHLAYQSVFLP
jgi:hypothetical protein